MNKTMGWMGLGFGVVVAGALMGCGDLFAIHWDLTSATVDGVPARAVAASGADGVTVQLDTRGQGVAHGVTITVGAPLEAIAPGVLEGDAIDLAVELCDGANPVCVRTEGAALEITDLEDRTRRVEYRATRVAADGTRIETTGSFVLVAEPAR